MERPSMYSMAQQLTGYRGQLETLSCYFRDGVRRIAVEALLKPDLYALIRPYPSDGDGRALNDKPGATSFL